MDKNCNSDTVDYLDIDKNVDIRNDTRVDSVIDIQSVAHSYVLDCKEEINLKFPLSGKRLLLNESMSSHSSFRVGGSADLVFLPSSMEEAILAIQISKNMGIPFTILGNGSNILVSDKGIRGLTIIFGQEFAKIDSQDNSVLVVDCGALLSKVAKFASKKSLAGMEFAAGIPGSIGGAVYMNAGAYDGCMANIVVKTQGYDPNTKDLFLLETSQEHQFAYRESFFEKTNSIVLRTWLQLKEGNMQEINEKMDEFACKRKNSQPLDVPSAGSTFKRPLGCFAGKLIEDAGLKGCRIGGACVSLKHAGFIVNDGNATARDVLDLINKVQECVYKEHGVKIDPEIRMIGEW